MTLSLDGAFAAERLIRGAYEFALHSLRHCNNDRFDYWIERTIHFRRELDWIRGQIEELRAAADGEANRPDYETPQV